MNTYAYMHTSNKENLTIEFPLFFRLSGMLRPAEISLCSPFATHLCRLGEVFSSRTRTRCQTRSTACPRKIHGRHNSTNRLRNITFQTSLARLKRDSILIQLLSSCLRLFLPTCAQHSSFCCFLLPSSHHRPNTSAPAESTARFPPMKVCALPSARAFRQETSSCPP